MRCAARMEGGQSCWSTKTSNMTISSELISQMEDLFGTFLVTSPASNIPRPNMHGNNPENMAIRFAPSHRSTFVSEAISPLGFQRFR